MMRNCLIKLQSREIHLGGRNLFVQRIFALIGRFEFKLTLLFIAKVLSRSV